MHSKLPQALFFIASSFLLIGYGVLASEYKIFPYEFIVSGGKTAAAYYDNLTRDDLGSFQGFAETTPAEAIKNRIQFIKKNTLDDPVLFFGGRFQFNELIPGNGAIAVEYDVFGKAKHAYAFHPIKIFQANIADNYPYETAGFNFVRDVRPTGILRYSNGDLLIVFQNKNTFPFGGGSCRIAQDGTPRWFRWDYSHHWPTFLKDDVALIPGLSIMNESIVVELKEDKIELPCDTEKPYNDLINMVDGNGKLLRQIPIVEALMASPFRAVLQHTSDPCDPVHLNYIDVLGEDAGGSWGLKPGDFVVSLRNLSAMGIMDPKSGKFKRLVRGTFFQQHSIHHFRKAEFIMFDNQGASESGGPSRLLKIDLATGLETTIFPNESTPEEYGKLFSYSAGKIDISKDKKRAIVIFSGESRAVEVNISDGKILNIFNAFHDVSAQSHFPEDKANKAAKFRLYGVDYIN